MSSKIALQREIYELQNRIVAAKISQQERAASSPATGRSNISNTQPPSPRRTRPKSPNRVPHGAAAAIQTKALWSSEEQTISIREDNATGVPVSTCHTNDPLSISDHQPSTFQKKSTGRGFLRGGLDIASDHHPTSKRTNSFERKGFGNGYKSSAKPTCESMNGSYSSNPGSVNTNDSSDAGDGFHDATNCEYSSDGNVRTTTNVRQKAKSFNHANPPDIVRLASGANKNPPKREISVSVKQNTQSKATDAVATSDLNLLMVELQAVKDDLVSALECPVAQRTTEELKTDLRQNIREIVKSELATELLAIRKETQKDLLSQQNFLSSLHNSLTGEIETKINEAHKLKAQESPGVESSVKSHEIRTELLTMQSSLQNEIHEMIRSQFSSSSESVEEELQAIRIEQSEHQQETNGMLKEMKDMALQNIQTMKEQSQYTKMLIEKHVPETAVKDRNFASMLAEIERKRQEDMAELRSLVSRHAATEVNARRKYVDTNTTEVQTPLSEATKISAKASDLKHLEQARCASDETTSVSYSESKSGVDLSNLNTAKKNSNNEKSSVSKWAHNKATVAKPQQTPRERFEIGGSQNASTIAGGAVNTAVTTPKGESNNVPASNSVEIVAVKHNPSSTSTEPPKAASMISAKNKENSDSKQSKITKMVVTPSKSVPSAPIVESDKKLQLGAHKLSAVRGGFSPGRETSWPVQRDRTMTLEDQNSNSIKNVKSSLQEAAAEISLERGEDLAQSKILNQRRKTTEHSPAHVQNTPNQHVIAQQPKRSTENAKGKPALLSQVSANSTAATKPEAQKEQGPKGHLAATKTISHGVTCTSVKSNSAVSTRNSSLQVQDAPKQPKLSIENDKGKTASSSLLSADSIAAVKLGVGPLAATKTISQGVTCTSARKTPFGSTAKISRQVQDVPKQVVAQQPRLSTDTDTGKPALSSSVSTNSTAEAKLGASQLAATKTISHGVTCISIRKTPTDSTAKTFGQGKDLPKQGVAQQPKLQSGNVNRKPAFLSKVSAKSTAVAKLGAKEQAQKRQLSATETNTQEVANTSVKTISAGSILKTTGQQQGAPKQVVAKLPNGIVKGKPGLLSPVSANSIAVLSVGKLGAKEQPPQSQQTSPKSNSQRATCESVETTLGSTGKISGQVQDVPRQEIAQHPKLSKGDVKEKPALLSKISDNSTASVEGNHSRQLPTVQLSQAKQSPQEVQQTPCASMTTEIESKAARMDVVHNSLIDSTESSMGSATDESETVATMDGSSIFDLDYSPKKPPNATSRMSLGIPVKEPSGVRESIQAMESKASNPVVGALKEEAQSTESADETSESSTEESEGNDCDTDDSVKQLAEELQRKKQALAQIHETSDTTCVPADAKLHKPPAPVVASTVSAGGNPKTSRVVERGSNDVEMCNNDNALEDEEDTTGESDGSEESTTQSSVENDKLVSAESLNMGNKEELELRKRAMALLGLGGPDETQSSQQEESESEEDEEDGSSEEDDGSETNESESSPPRNRGILRKSSFDSDDKHEWPRRRSKNTLIISKDVITKEVPRAPKEEKANLWYDRDEIKQMRFSAEQHKEKKELKKKSKMTTAIDSLPSFWD